MFYLFKYSFLYRRAVMVSVGCLVLYSLSILALPWAVRLIVNTAFVADGSSQLNLYCVILLGILPLIGIALYCRNYWLDFINNRLVADLRTDVFHHLLELPLEFFSQHRRGAILSRVTSDIMVIYRSLFVSYVELLRQVILLLGGLILMLILNWKFALLALTCVPVVVLITLVFSRKIRDLATEVQDKSARLSTVIEETLSGIKEIKSYTQEDYEQKRFTSTIEARFAAMMRQNHLKSLFEVLVFTAVTAILVLLVWLGGHDVINERMTLGDLVAILFYMWIAIGPIRGSAGNFSRLQEAIGTSRRINEILNTVAERDNADGIVVPDLKGELIFENIFYQYPGTSRTVLNNISFTADPGMVIAIVGRSGAGKTTLVNLLPRFFEARSGKILIDGNPISKLKLSSLRSQIGLVPQETFLFGGTIAENISYSCPGTSEDQIIEAAKAADAHKFIMETPEKYNTIIGDRGVKLSAGQRQRIAIARLFLKNCRIVILDEATSSLDYESARSVNKTIKKLLKGRTAFIITHKLTSIKKADLILVLDNGEIVEQGTHDQLLEMNGVFKSLYGAE